jgi:non-ribosomal peptide synthetase component F
MNTHGRYKEELIPIIGMFVNAIPLRCQLDPHWSLHQLFKQVQQMMMSSRKYSYFPLQRILAQHPNTSKAAFLDNSFVFQSSENQNIGNEVMIGDSRLHSMPMLIKINENEIMSKFDFALTIQYNKSTNQFSCTMDGSLDLFDTRTVDKIVQRFHSVLQLFFQVNIDDQMKKRIYELPLLLPDERLLMQSINNTQVSFPHIHCIHHKFVYQVLKHPQKLGIELDDQSLTYSELLHYVQVLCLTCLKKRRVIVGEIVCLCIERSLSMVS